MKCNEGAVTYATTIVPSTLNVFYPSAQSWHVKSNNWHVIVQQELDYLRT